MRNNFKKLLNHLLFPHIAIIIFLTAVSPAALFLAFAVLPDNLTINYISYVLSAYTLAVICIRIPRMVKKAREIKEANKYVSLFSTDHRLRISLSLTVTLIFNAIYALLQLYLGIVNSSLWFYSFAGYYFLLSIMRVALLSHTAKHRPGEEMFTEQLIYRMCGIGILLMTLAITVINIYVSADSQTKLQNEITTIAMAAFTFTSLTVAIVNVIRYRRFNSPVWSASKALSFVSALVSMLTLEDAMLASFGSSEDGGFRRTMVMFTGAGIAIAVIAIAVIMIIHSTKTIKRLKKQDGE